MRALSIFRAVLHIVAAIVFVAGLITVIIAVCSSQWRVSYLDEGSTGDRHEHGLWKDCIYDKTLKDSFCALSEPRIPSNDEEHPHYMEGMEQVTLIMLATGILVGLVVVVLSAVTSCIDLFHYRPSLKIAGVAWIVFSAICVILNGAALGYFAYNTNLPKNLYNRINTITVQNNLARDFYRAVYGTAVIAASLIPASISVVLMFILAGGPYVYVKVAREKAHLYPDTAV